MTRSPRQERRLNSALYVPCSLVQLARVVVCVRVLVDVICVMVVVLIAHHTVGAVLVAIFVVMYSLHLPSVTVNCVDCNRNDHCKFCTKFFVRLMPQINRRFTDCRRFPRSISVKSIVVVMSQRRDATKKFAIATIRRNFATNFHSTLCPPLS